MFCCIFDCISENWQFLLGLFVAQGVVGILMFEWAWKQAERVRADSSEEALAQEYPSFRRRDVHLWNRSKFYPGCFLILVPRTIWIIFWFAMIGVLQIFSFYGQRSADEPCEGWRRTLQKRGLWFMGPLVVLGFGYRIKLSEYSDQEVDYSKYLGPNWRSTKYTGKQVPSFICNHIAFIEQVMWCSVLPRPPAFTPAGMVKKIIGVNRFVEANQSIYIDRDASKEGLDSQVSVIAERQELISKSDKDYGPICLFAEGSVTNGLNLSRFRRGAFTSGLPVQPCYQKYGWETVSPDYSTLKGLELSLIMIAEMRMQILHAHMFPVFVPNEYMYTEYAKTLPDYKNLEKWQIYASAVEDFMRTQGKFGKNEQQLREKVSYQKFIWGQKDEVTVNGKTFYWPPRGKVGFKSFTDSDKSK